MAEITVRMQLSPERAVEFLTRLARDEGFREALATRPQSVLEEYNISIQSSDESFGFATSLPPKHVVEEALVNYKAANQFAPDPSPGYDPPLGFWPFLAFLATTDH
jgi:hypothetical protein